MKVVILSGAPAVPDAFRYKSAHLFGLAGGNLGNVAIIHSLYDHLRSVADVLPWHTSPDLIRERYDLIVFACANMLGAHTDLGPMAAALERMRLPVIAIGLGAQADDMSTDITLTPGTRRWLDIIAASHPGEAPNIGMRGAFSLRQVERFGHGDRVVITGCPSNMTNTDPGLGALLRDKLEQGEPRRIAVPAGMCHWPQLMELERQLVGLVDRTDGVYIAQHDIDMVRICRDEFDDVEPNLLAHMGRYLRPGTTLDEFKGWCRRYGTTYVDAASWMDGMRKFDFVVGPRFHGVMLGIQAGTPGGVIAHDSRTMEMCETMLLPVRHYKTMPKTLEPAGLAELFPFDQAAYDRRRGELCTAYLSILTGAALEPRADLAALAAP